MEVKLKEIQYRQDVLGAGYECADLEFPADYEGKVIATLIRKKAQKSTRKAVLYIHGFIDYFFQTEMAEKFNEQDFDFYALDLRKYGRSHLAHQQFYNVRNLSEYDAEISQALDIIGLENHNSILLCGHSTGGLITTLYAVHHPYHPLIKALWVNSPFYDFNKTAFEQKFGIPCISQFGKYTPDLEFPSGLNRWYTPSLHRSMYGEWNFNLEWKKEKFPKVRLSFIRAIYEAQKEIHKGLYLSVPTLVMYSNRTTNPKQWNADAKNSDIILNVKDIEKYALKMSGNIQLCTIENGMHDLVLSSAPVREKVYSELFKWLNFKIS